MGWRLIAIGSWLKENQRLGIFATVHRAIDPTHFEKGSTAPMYAASVCNEFGAELTLLHVAEGHTGAANAKGARELSRRLYSVVPAEAGLWRQPVCVIRHGLPSAQILEVARGSGADLIVLGARHPEPAKINSHLPWATAARVIAEAGCPVLTVRQRNSYEL